MQLDLKRIEEQMSGAETPEARAEAALLGVSTQLEENRVRLDEYRRGGAVIEGLADEFVIEGAKISLTAAKSRVDAMIETLRADPAGALMRGGKGVFDFLDGLGLSIL